MNTSIIDHKTSRRSMLKGLGLGGLGLASLPLLESSADAAIRLPAGDAGILNFALNLEYLEAEYYSYATTGASIQTQDTSVNGSGTFGGVTIKASPQVPFAFDSVRQYAMEIANDERAHVALLRALISNAGFQPIARPALNLRASFTAFAQAAGVVGEGETFDPFADDASFVIGAFIFEDVGVTAYRGAAPSLVNKNALSIAAGILGAEAYHAGLLRTLIFQTGGAAVDAAQKISDLRDALDGGSDLDQGVVLDDAANIVPANDNAITFARSIRQVLNIVYGAPGAIKGGFFPNGVNR